MSALCEFVLNRQGVASAWLHGLFDVEALVDPLVRTMLLVAVPLMVVGLFSRRRLWYIAAYGTCLLGALISEVSILGQGEQEDLASLAWFVLPPSVIVGSLALIADSKSRMKTARWQWTGLAVAWMMAVVMPGTEESWWGFDKLGLLPAGVMLWLGLRACKLRQDARSRCVLRTWATALPVVLLGVLYFATGWIGYEPAMALLFLVYSITPLEGLAALRCTPGRTGALS